jgi:uncharacterized protein
VVAYLDTSVLGRVLLGEPDRPAILRALGAFELRVASRLTRVELRRLALRHNVLADADQLLAGVALIPLDDDLLTAAETIPPATVATLDAIHLATALRLARADRLDALLTYDVRLAGGAREHGLEVLAPA